MQLQILTPSSILLSEKVQKIITEAPGGSFCLLPRHIDFVTALVPGLLLYTDADNKEHFLAVDEGILVKQGEHVRVSTRRAIRGESLETLRQTVKQEFRQLDEKEKQLRSSLARLEADVVRRFLELEGRHG